MSNETGGHKKINFRAFRSNAFEEKDAISHAEYAAMINPASIMRTLNVVSNNKGSRGSAHSDGQWMGLESEILNFDLIFDGTGLVDPSRMDIDQEIDKFLKVVYVCPDTNNEASFVEIVYGKLNVLCKLKSMNITYQLFNKDGHPIRAKLSCSFITVQKPKIKKKKASSAKQKPLVCVCKCDCYDTALDKAKAGDYDSLNQSMLQEQ